MKLGNNNIIYKKSFYIILIISVCFLLTGCFKKEPVKVDLTADNFSDYIILNVQLDNADTKSKVDILGMQYKGVASLKATAKLKKDVQVDNVVIEGFISPTGLLWSGEKYNFKLELDKNGEAEYSQDIETDYSILKPEEHPNLSKYYGQIEEGQFLAADDKAVITTLTGSIYEKVK